METSAPLPEMLDPDATRLPAGLEPVEPAYRWALMIRQAASLLPLVIGALMLDTLVLGDWPWRGALGLGALVIALAIVFATPRRIWRRLGFALDDRHLRVVRGWLFHVDTIVPLVRVQHIDVARGPIDKLVGTASLVVHTAGTHNSTVVLPGLDPERAETMREAIRAKVRTDWQ